MRGVVGAAQRHARVVFPHLVIDIFEASRFARSAARRVVHECVQLARRVTKDVLDEDRPAVRVVVKVRYKPFFTSTHGVALAAPTTDQGEIEQAALAALAKFTDRRPVRLLGVRAEFPDA